VARISIGKVTTNDEAEPNYAKVEIVTDEYVVRVKLALPDFAHLILGQIMPCEVEVKPRTTRTPAR